MRSVSIEDADRIAIALEATGYTCVPLAPTERMVDAAWENALAEDAAGVWHAMLKAASSA
jgi:hypothetical protein